MPIKRKIDELTSWMNWNYIGLATEVGYVLLRYVQLRIDMVFLPMVCFSPTIKRGRVS
jgi:hypothetical protein